MSGGGDLRGDLVGFWFCLSGDFGVVFGWIGLCSGGCLVAAGKWVLSWWFQMDLRWV